MINKGNNVTAVYEEDKSLIRTLISLSPEKKVLVKGILIGMEIQNNLTMTITEDCEQTSRQSA